MKNAMRVNLYDFFDIKSAEIDLKPLMIICGDNGTGKTHLIKLLSKINEQLLNGVLFKVKEQYISEISDFLNVDLLKEKLLLRQSIDIELNSEMLEEMYVFLEKIVNKNFNDNINSIWKDTFGADLKNKNLKKIKLQFNNRTPNLRVLINFNEDKKKQELQLNLLKALENVSDQEFKEDILGNLLEELNQLNPMNFVNITFEIKTSEYISHRGLSMMGEHISIENQLDQIICTTLDNIFAHLYLVDIGLKDVSPEVYYLPASREAYHRDLEYFRKKANDKNDSFLITRYIVDKKGKKTTNFISKDPFIEKYIENIIMTLTRDVKADSSNKKTYSLMNYFEREILGAKILVDAGRVQFKLPDENIITPSMASSLQNEYSLLKILIERSNKPNLIIEEPESHLSIKNAIKLAYFLLCYQQSNKNLLWLTTHNNFIGDAINNFFMISKLPESEQKHYLEKLGIYEIAQKIDSDFGKEIAAYLICDNELIELPINDYGINFENFNNDINKFINITAELQIEMENLF